MRVPEVKTCCCGCSLETGTVIIGWLYLVGSILMAVGCVIGIISPSSNNHDGMETSKATLIIGLIAAIFTIVMSILLLIGVKRRLAKYVQYWILVTTLGLVLNVFTTFAQGIMMAVNGAVGGGVTYILIGLISAAIVAYLIIVVFNFKREILSENQHV